MENQSFNRDFSAISPTAKSILFLKALTDIPYARKAAELITYPEPYLPDFKITDPAYWARVFHFERRYWSINQLLAGLEIENILELSSGFSFRGLDMVRNRRVHYIDTDLEEMINKKQDLINLMNDKKNLKGQLYMMALNGLDENNFNEVVSYFPHGPLVIVNEGLLMYLDASEKEKICAIIKRILLKRGGYWITADIYRKTSLPELQEGKDELKKITDQQRIEEKMFDSFETARQFFEEQGFVIDKESERGHHRLRSYEYLFENVSEEQLSNMREQPEVQVTWRLKVS